MSLQSRTPKKNPFSHKYFLQIGMYLAFAGPSRTSPPLHPKPDEELEPIIGKEAPKQSPQRNMPRQLYQVRSQLV